MLEFQFLTKGDKMAINVNIMCQLDLLDNWRRSLENEFMRSVALPSILTFFMKSRNNKDTLALALYLSWFTQRENLAASAF